MARKPSETMTEVERKIMEILWDNGESSVREIANALRTEKPTAYTTVQTMCKVLLEKKYVTYRAEGKAFLYSPLVSKLQAQAKATKALLDQFFGGSGATLAQHLIDQNALDEKDLKDLHTLINETAKGEKNDQH